MSLVPDLRNWLLRTLIPVTQWIGRNRIPLRYHRISRDNYVSLKAILKPGHVILTRRTGELNNFLIPGFWTHASMYLGNEEVAEAVSEGVIITKLEAFLCGAIHGKDYVMVRDALYLGDADKAVAAEVARSKAGCPYDWVFDITDDRAFYCSKLVWYALEQAYRRSHLGAASPFTLMEALGVPTVTPEDIAEADKKWKTIYMSAGGEAPTAVGAL